MHKNNNGFFEKLNISSDGTTDTDLHDPPLVELIFGVVTGQEDAEDPPLSQEDLLPVEGQVP